MNKAFAKVALTASLMTPLIASAFCMQPVYGNNQQLNRAESDGYRAASNVQNAIRVGLFESASREAHKIS